MNNFIIFLMSMIDGKHLRSAFRSGNCCENSPFYDNCCILEIESASYSGHAILDFYNEKCCGEYLSCGIDLSACENCTQFNSVCMQDIITEVYELRYCGGKVSIFPYLPYISHTKKYYFQSEYEIFYTSPNNFPEGLLPLNYNESVYFSVGNTPTSLKINTIYENILNTTACLNVNMIVLHLSI